MTAVFLYLSARSMINRVRRWLRRLREPRYAIGFVIGLAYLYLMVFRQIGRGGRSGGPSSALATSGIAGLFPLVASVILFVVAALAWAWPGSSRAVTFTRAEVQFFFPAPVTRRQLLHYKLLRTQVGTLISTVILTVLFRRGSLVDGWMFFSGMWLGFAILNLYFTGVSLSRSSLLQHGASALRRQWVPIALVVGAIGVLVTAVARDWAVLAALGTPGEVMTELDRLAAHGVVSWLLWPFRAVARVPLAASAGEYWRALPAALAVLVVNYVWVIRSDAAFEEASADRAEKVAQMRSAIRQGRSLTIKATPTPFVLAATGPVETAIMWKNLILLGRYVSLKTLLRLLPVVLVFALVVSGSQRGGVVTAAAMLCLMAIVMTVLLGPQIARNDLRQDLGRLVVLKTWPVRGATLLRGEILAPAALLTGIAWLCIVGGMFLVTSLPNRGGAALSLVLNRLSYGAAAMFVAPALILVQLVVQNGIAVMFPAWIAIGASRARGIDAMGQRLLLMAGILLTLALALIPAALVAGAAGFAVYWTMGIVPVILPAALGSAILVVECWVAVQILGRVLDRTDVSAIEPVE